MRLGPIVEFANALKRFGLDHFRGTGISANMPQRDVGDGGVERLHDRPDNHRDRDDPPVQMVRAALRRRGTM